MTPLALKKIITRRKLRRVDAAWIAGVSTRHVRSWLTGAKAIPQYADLIFTAYEQNILTDDWLVKHIKIGVPRATSDFY